MNKTRNLTDKRLLLRVFVISKLVNDNNKGDMFGQFYSFIFVSMRYKINMKTFSHNCGIKMVGPLSFMTVVS